MNKRLNDYLDERDAKELDERIVEKYTAAMKNETIPQIVEDIKRNEELAAALRFSPGTASRRERKNN